MTDVRKHAAGLAASCFALAACSAGVAAPATPQISRELTGVRLIGVHCLVDTERGVSAEAGEKLCADMLAVAAGDAPAPVVVLPLGDPRLTAPGTLTLLVHATSVPAARVAPGAGGRLLALTVRPHRASAPGESLFGTAPVLMREDDPAALRRAVLAALPWRAPDEAARPLP